MTQRVSSWIGWGALAAFAVTGLYAWTQVKERVTITLSQGDVQAVGALDPLAVMQDDLASLRVDLQSLAQSIGQALESSHADLESSGAARDQATQQAIASLATEMNAQSKRSEALQQALQGRLAALESLVADRSAAIPEQGASQSPPEIEASSKNLAAQPAQVQDSTSISIPAQVSADQPRLESPGDALAKQTPLSDAAVPSAASQVGLPPSLPAASAEAKPEAKTKGFLSFQLPSQQFDLAALQRFVVLPNLSRVGFDAKSTLHDFSGTSQSIRGEWTARLSQPAQALAGFIALPSKSLDTQNSGRDEEMFKLLAVEQAPELRFQISGFVPEGATGLGPSSPTLRGSVRGTMTIKGKSREMSMPVRLRLDESKRLVVEGETELALSDYGVDAPNKLGVISMNDRVRIWIALRARCVGQATEDLNAR